MKLQELRKLIREEISNSPFPFSRKKDLWDKQDKLVRKKHIESQPLDSNEEIELSQIENELIELNKLYDSLSKKIRRHPKYKSLGLRWDSKINQFYDGKGNTFDVNEVWNIIN